MDVSQIITIAATLIGMLGMASGFVWAIKTNTMILDVRLTQQNEQIKIMQQDLKKLNEVVTSLALQDQRTTSIEQRITAQGKRIELLDERFEELRHGEGFVYPLAEAIRKRGSSD